MGNPNAVAEGLLERFHEECFGEDLPYPPNGRS